MIQIRLELDTMLGWNVRHIHVSVWSQEPYTSSRERACRKVLIVVFAAVNGRVRLMITPTLANVSLGTRTAVNDYPGHQAHSGQERLPDANKIDLNVPAESLLEASSQRGIIGIRALV